MLRRLFTIPGWITLSATLSGLFILAALWLHRDSLPVSSQVSASMVQPLPSPQPGLGDRHQLTYQQWVALLGREAKVAAEHSPRRLVVLAGDSLSLWFPPELLPSEVTWLNQGISGETSAGLLQRLSLFDKTRPETIFVMIGINDLLRGIRSETVLANQREIIRHLKTVHPRARIVVQSILPHGGKSGSVPNNLQTSPLSDRLLAVSNRSIRSVNQQLAAIAKEEGVEYLDLYPDFSDSEGDLAPELSTDGLHLSPQGYWIWASRLQTFSR
ncbi:GDSL-type esterase/lipase family protein [Kovacikia minuta CCNUW1]|uniref:SGNH/GDSL hydrolase family protein n=1 Tax=Kovacikia minuta TaxID=2931930 RepID=UPI001CC94D8A|nr:SGNH/GDSL hydrolase family protein [Kovacikia minuta]UBF28018.1 GDSL-type esterase/lipase family protein [Kovacikia minuta CCNUW1]